MADTPYKTALIVGVGAGLSASVARTFRKAGMTIALTARRAGDLAALAQETGGKAFLDIAGFVFGIRRNRNLARNPLGL